MHTRHILRYCSLALIGAVCLAVAVQAQPFESLSGRVVDASTNEPLPSVNIFIAETTIGTTTDNAGQFEILRLPTRLSFKLVVSMVGFEVASQTLQRDALPDTALVFALTPKTIDLGEVEVVASNKEWKQNLERFEKLFFSSTDNARKCKVLNPEVLDFSFERGILQAQSDAPLIIENRALGYQLVIHDVSLVGREHQLRWGGEMQFIEFQSEKEKDHRNWKKNRLKAYRGSARHFLASLIAGTARDDGFIAYHVQRPGIINLKTPIFEMEMNSVYQDDYTPVLHDQQPDGTWIIRFPFSLLVTYEKESEPRQYTEYQFQEGLRLLTEREERAGRLERRDFQASWLTLHNESLIVDVRGREYSDYAMMRYGFWAWERMGEQLPYDFQPDQGQ